MHFVGKSKIGRLSAKKGKIYAQIRLPPQLVDTIGEIADVFETECDGKRALLLVTKQSVLEDDIVLQHSERVVQPDDKTNSERRLYAIESQIAELKSLLLKKEDQKDCENTKTDGLEAIRTPDLRRVKAESLALERAFSCLSGLDETITRNASAPWYTV